MKKFTEWLIDWWMTASVEIEGEKVSRHSILNVMHNPYLFTIITCLIMLGVFVYAGG